jgi:hypothetical protein
MFVIATIPFLRVTVAGVPLYASDVLIVIAVIVALRRRDSPLPPAGRKALVLLLAYDALLVLSAARTWFETGALAETLYLLLRYGLSTGAFFAALKLLPDPDGYRRFMVALAAGTAVACLWGVTQVALPEVGTPLTVRIYESFGIGLDRFFGQKEPRAMAGYYAATSFGGYLMVVTPLLMHTPVLRTRTRVPLVLLIIVTLTLTFTRHVWIGLPLCLAIATLRHPRHGPRLTTFVAVATLALSATSALLEVEGRLRQRASTLEDVTSDVSIMTRLTGHARFVEAMTADPAAIVTGHGFGLRKLVSRGSAGVLDDNPAVLEGAVSDAWLLVAFFSGFVAFALYLGAFLVTASSLVRKPIRSMPRPMQREAVSYVALMVAIFLAHLADNYMYTAIHMNHLAWILPALAIVRLDARAAPRAPPISSR